MFILDFFWIIVFSFNQGYFISLTIKLIYVLLGSLASFTALKLQKQCLSKAPKQTALKETITSSPTLASQLPQALACSTLGEHMTELPRSMRWSMPQKNGTYISVYVYIYIYIMCQTSSPPGAAPKPIGFFKVPSSSASGCATCHRRQWYNSQPHWGHPPVWFGEWTAECVFDKFPSSHIRT